MNYLLCEQTYVGARIVQTCFFQQTVSLFNSIATRQNVTLAVAARNEMIGTGEDGDEQHCVS